MLTRSATTRSEGSLRHTRPERSQSGKPNPRNWKIAKIAKTHASADRIVAAAVDVVVVLAPSVAPLGVPTNAPHSGAEHWLSACWPTSRRDSRASA